MEELFEWCISHPKNRVEFRCENEETGVIRVTLYKGIHPTSFLVTEQEKKEGITKYMDMALIGF